MPAEAENRPRPGRAWAGRGLPPVLNLGGGGGGERKESQHRAKPCSGSGTAAPIHRCHGGASHVPSALVWLQPRKLPALPTQTSSHLPQSGGLSKGQRLYFPPGLKQERGMQHLGGAGGFFALTGPIRLSGKLFCGTWELG